MSNPKFDLVISNAQIADPASVHANQTVDVGIRNGMIAAIGTDLEGVATFDAQRAWLSPGWLDLYATCPDPGEEWTEDLEHLAKAAAHGGFTDVCVLGGKQPAADQASVVRYIKSHHRAAAHAALHPLGSSTLGLAGKDLDALFEMHQGGAVAFTNGNNPLHDHGMLMRLMQYASQRNLVLFHTCLDQGIAGNSSVHEGLQSTMLGLKGIPSLAEEIAVAATLRIAKHLDVPVHISRISCAESVQLIRAAKLAGQAVSTSVPALNLLFDDTELEHFDTNLKTMPPLRAATDREALIEGLLDGTIDAVVSNHQPRNQEQKFVEWDYAAYGANTLQIVSACMGGTGRLLPAQWVQLLAHGPRKVLGMSPLIIDTGMPAKLTLFQPEATWIPNQADNQSKGINNPLWGRNCIGKAIITVNEGRITAHIS